jgi:iron-sulfur cluster assembly protein
MALDEPKDTDDVFKINGFKFVVDKDLMKEAAPIKVDCSGFGFQFDCALQFDEGCTACSSACG